MYKSRGAWKDVERCVVNVGDDVRTREATQSPALKHLTPSFIPLRELCGTSHGHTEDARRSDRSHWTG
jgi:hypothetical protein